MTILLLSLLIELAATTPSGALPAEPTPAAQLSTQHLRHHALMRFDRDFGMSHWQIALDGWTPRDRAGHIEDVRLWWINTRDAGHRKPFSASLRRRVEFGYTRQGDGSLAVRLAGDDKEFRFEIAVRATGEPAIFADVELPDDTVVSRCRCTHGRVIARRVLGIPVGIEMLEMTCIDGQGHTRHGAVVHRAVRSD